MKILACLLLLIGASASAFAEDFTKTVQSILAQTEATHPLAVQGSASGWFFLRKELDHLQHGDLAKVDLSKANKEGTDPLPVIAKYQEALKALGVDLLLVPVPPKASIYPEKLSDKIDPQSVPSMAGLYAKLKELGVTVLDLETAFKEERVKHPEKQLYCATDSHWSPYACELAAQLVAARLKDLPGLKQTALSKPTTLPEEILEFHGDLLEEAQRASVPKEKLPLQRAGEAMAGKTNEVQTVESDPKSAVLAIGDSHLMVFRKGGDMLATQGGFIDHLQVDLDAAIQEITMQAGGADGPRREIARSTVKDPNFWTAKKVVLWVFTAREFTEGKWKAYPATLKK